jgi:hypothetical protein
MLTTAAMLIGIGAAAAQPREGVRTAVLITEMPAASPVGISRSPVSVLERLVSFDANRDKLISRDELPERMQGLIARGDRNSDAALDAAELDTLVGAAAAERTTRAAFRPQTSDGLAGVVNDLKLPPEKHAAALALVGAHKPPDRPDRANGAISSDLYREMQALLDGEDYDNFVAAAERLSRNPLMRFRILGGVVGGIKVPPPPPR